MTKFLSIKITEYLLKKGIIALERKAWCIYALERRMSTFVTVSFIMIVCGLHFGIVETLIFSFSMLSIRRRTGGYHVSTPIACLALSVGIVFFGLYVAQFLASKALTLSIILVISDILIFWLAPINHPNLKLTPQEMAKNRELSLKITTLTTVAAFFLCIAFPTKLWGACAILGIACAALSVAAAKFLRQEVKTNEQN